MTYRMWFLFSDRITNKKTAKAKSKSQRLPRKKKKKEKKRLRELCRTGKRTLTAKCPFSSTRRGLLDRLPYLSSILHNRYGVNPFVLRSRNATAGAQQSQARSRAMQNPVRVFGGDGVAQIGRASDSRSKKPEVRIPSGCTKKST